MKKLIFLSIFLSFNAHAAWQGYVEGEYLYLAASVAGRLQHLPISRGQDVQAGELLFSLENQPESFAVQEAESKMLSAKAKLEDLQKGQRPSELEVLKAKKSQAQTDLTLSEKEAVRVETLLKQNLIQKESVDVARANVQRNKAKLTEIEAQLQTAHLGSREDQIKAAENDFLNAQATYQKAQWTLAQKSLVAPQNGIIHEIYYRVGEWLNIGTPVLALLPPSAVKIRFYISETVLGKLQVNQTVKINCDSCPKNLIATINFISTQAEYTPPVLYNLENRAKLVWRIEAKPSPEIAKHLHVGQPIDVIQ
jgi:HlyD family secretion protein